MGDNYQYPVFFKCHNVLLEQNKKKVTSYFQIKRKSGGGECGPVTTVADDTYSVAFKDQKDQSEVLKRCEHTVELPCGQLVFVVTDRPLSSNSSSNIFSTAPQDIESDSRRIVILGKTGSGKSSVGNTILQEDRFSVCHGAISGQSLCQTEIQSFNGREITLIDTPGFFDTNMSEESLKDEMLKCITECSPGPHAFLIVLELGRFTPQENDIIHKITQYFSEEVFTYATVVFTHGDKLPKEQDIKKYFSTHKDLREIIKKCGGRCHVIDNKYWNNCSNETYRSNAYQVKNILKSIEETVKENNGMYYTNNMLQRVEIMTQNEERCVLHEEQQLPKSSGNMSREGIRKEAKRRVWEILKKVQGVSLDVLLKAFFGAVAAGIVIAAYMAGYLPGAETIELVGSAGARMIGLAEGGTVTGTGGFTGAAGAAVVAAAALAKLTTIPSPSI